VVASPDQLDEVPAPRASRAGWLIGLLLLGALIAVVSQRAEEREILALARRSEPLWLLAAIALQALTYVCAGSVWQRALVRVGAQRQLRSLIPLGLAKLFTDQALPSAGLSGSLLVMRSLVRRGIPRPSAVGALVTGVFGYFAANAIAALLALGALASRGEASPLVWGLAAAVCFVSALVPALILVLRSAAASWLPEPSRARTACSARSRRRRASRSCARAPARR
jgi:uncharacterized membrane protein YbhN (UPF0104 family)